MTAKTEPLRAVLQEALPDRPFRIDLWDGTSLPSTNGDGPAFHIRSPAALGHLLRAPGQLGVGRAYVTGSLDVDDLEAGLRIVDAWSPPPLDARTKGRIATAAVRAGALRRVPPSTAAELRPKGRRHSIARDRRAVRHHYDVGNSFFALFLDQSMTYSCAIFSRGATTLEEAQRTKLELVCTKLALKADERVLDVGCGWGSFAIHAAGEHGVHVTGITLSEPQAVLARERVAAAGLQDRIDIRVADYREIRGETYDAIASIGMVEHVGRPKIDTYAAQLASLLRPGGRLLNHGVARLGPGAGEDETGGPFSARFVFPDGAPMRLSRLMVALEQAGFVPEHVESFAEDYSKTLREWARRLDERRAEAERIAGPERLRVWRLYLRAARNGFDTGLTSIYQVLARMP